MRKSLLPLPCLTCSLLPPSSSPSSLVLPLLLPSRYPSLPSLSLCGAQSVAALPIGADTPRGVETDFALLGSVRPFSVASVRPFGRLSVRSSVRPSAGHPPSYSRQSRSLKSYARARAVCMCVCVRVLWYVQLRFLPEQTRIFARLLEQSLRFSLFLVCSRASGFSLKLRRPRTS